VALGSATITATLGSVSGQTSLTVDSASLSTIVVTPANQSIVSGTPLQFTATGNFSDGSEYNLTSLVTWNSSNACATISNATGSNGLATSVSEGSTTIAATQGNVSGNSTLTVTAALEIVDASMTGTTITGWTLGGTPDSAVLTAANGIDSDGDGWVRLTNAETNQSGSVYYDDIFDISQGAIISFDYATWGGTGADGCSVFLFDSSQTFNIGASGGSLGYAQKTVSPVHAGVPGGYFGVGLDEYGNYSNPTEGRVGGPGAEANAVGLRGPAPNYSWIGGTGTLAKPLSFPSQLYRPNQTSSEYRHVVIYITPVPAPNYTQVDVYIEFGYGEPLTHVLNGLMIGSAPPANVKIGFAASTGGSTNYHEIRNLVIQN
jgi:hypothetical protein